MYILIFLTGINHLLPCHPTLIGLLPLPNKFLLDNHIFFHAFIYLLVRNIYHGTTEDVGGSLVTVSSLLAP